MNSRLPTQFRFFLYGILAFMLATAFAQFPTTARAADAGDWDPGFIISDQIFFDGNSMNSAEIHDFLDSKVSNCRAGYVCLKDYVQVTPNMPSDEYCGGYFSGGVHSAADIIYGVGKACGISQRVLLVLLEKEQSLVSDTWPTLTQYNRATGFSCPDTAPCDPAYAGFFYQVYSAAHQFKFYGGNPNSFRYKAGRVNNIQFHPNVDCGSSQVYIANQATANLYIYTPYQPNSAALSNLYRTGDECSAYGNRNFWRIFSDWFGNPRTYTTDPKFVSFWNARGGVAGYMGAPTSFATFNPDHGGGWYQKFTYGVAYAPNYGPVSFVSRTQNYSQIYSSRGGPSSDFGWPTGEWQCNASWHCAQLFQAGALTSTPQYATHAIWGGFYHAWLALGGFNGSLGPALSEVRFSQNEGAYGWVQNFVGGLYVISTLGNVDLTDPRIVQSWYGAGAERSWIGWPNGLQNCQGGACAISFQNGVISAANNSSAYASFGGIVTGWSSAGGLSSSGLGAATGFVTYDANQRGNGWIQTFERGSQVVSSAGSFSVPGAASRYWTSSGTSAGWLGWPVSARSTASDGSYWQAFQGGVIFTSASGVTTPILGGLANYWLQNGGYQILGAPTSSTIFSDVNGGGWKQSFTNGVLTQRFRSSPIWVPSGQLLSTWNFYGAEYTWIGWPAGPQTCSGSGCNQIFQNGTARVEQGVVSFAP